MIQSIINAFFKERFSYFYILSIFVLGMLGSQLKLSVWIPLLLLVTVIDFIGSNRVK